MAYYRVSTRRQGASGLGVDAQRAAVVSNLGASSWVIVSEFTEVESGRRRDRLELERALG
ncbi:recombinase family protein [Tardiphaga sp. 42S5]|uniref:recombinase family protein n=1 Tax=Tardiphaga sp. 42S5 TaxID=1404799 RepID=UPI002A5A96E6|nr:recombinase family protein [Tardiphaga sp. 42S5]WPO44373.1 recombinase family protein [Tardiphaga sp. 42S5]